MEKRETYGLDDEEWELLVKKFGENPLKKIVENLAGSKSVRRSLDKRVGRPRNFVAVEGGLGLPTTAVYVDAQEVGLLIRAAMVKEAKDESEDRKTSGNYYRR